MFKADFAAGRLRQICVPRIADRRCVLRISGRQVFWAGVTRDSKAIFVPAAGHSAAA